MTQQDVFCQKLSSRIESHSQTSADNIINKVIDDAHNPNVQKEGGFETFVRDARRKLLLDLVAIKDSLLEPILNDIQKRTDVDELNKLKTMCGEMHDEERCIKSNQNEISKLNDIKPKNEHEKFLHYMHQEKESFVSEDYNEHIRKNHMRRAFGLGVVLLCALVDFFMLYTMFTLGNLGMRDSLMSAFIFAVVLDAPAYTLGWITTRRQEFEELTEITNETIQNESDSSNEGQNTKTEETPKKKMRLFKVASLSLGVLLVIVLLAYIFVRVITFLGAGDFEQAFRSIFSGDFNIAQQPVNAADLLSSIVPLATSVVSLVVGLFLYSSFADFLKESAIKIDKDMSDKIKNYEMDINNIKENLIILKEEYNKEKQKIWGFYIPHHDCVEDEVVYSGMISNAIIGTLMLDKYLETYRNCAKQIRAVAEKSLIIIKDSVVEQASDQNEIRKMMPSDDEISLLDKIWNEEYYAETDDVCIIKHRLDEVKQRISQ
jgi:hypothetical protein